MSTPTKAYIVEFNYTDYMFADMKTAQTFMEIIDKATPVRNQYKTLNGESVNVLEPKLLDHSLRMRIEYVYNPATYEAAFAAELEDAA